MVTPEDCSNQLTEQLGDVYCFRTLVTGAIIDLSPSFENLFQRSRQQVYGDPSEWLAAIHPADRKRVQDCLIHHLQTQTPYQDQYRLLWPDGSVHPVLQRSWITERVGQPPCSASVVQTLNAPTCSTVAHQPSPQNATAALANALNSTVVVIVSMRVYADYHWEWDYFSVGCERLFGFAVDEFMADPHLWLSRLPQADVEGVIMPLFDAIFAECDQAPHEYRFRRKDGELRWMQGNLSSRHDLQAGCWGVTIVTTDITAQKQAEAAVHQHRSMLQRVTDDLPQVLYIFNLEQQQNEYINIRIEDVLGYTPEQVKQPDFFENRFHPQDRARIEQHFQGWPQRPAGAIVELEYRMRHRHGDWRWLRSREVVFERNPEGQPSQVLGTAIDITLAKQTEADLEAILRSLSVCIGRFRLLTDGRRQYDYISPGSRTLWGFSPEAILAEPERWEANIDAEDWAGVILPFYETIQTEPDRYIEYRFYHPVVGLRWIAANLTVEADPATQSWIVTTVSWDISDHKQMELALTRQTRLERLLRDITIHIRQSLDLDTILATAVDEIRQGFNADRALIFQLLSDGSGQVIQEAVVPAYPVTDQMRWPDEDFPPDCYEHYRQGQPRIVADVRTDDWGSCLVEFMQSVGVQSKVVAPIVQKVDGRQSQVWGLIIIHACAERRVWQPEDAQLLQQVADQLAIAIQQAALYRQLQAANRQLHHWANTDPLTQVANRRAFEDYWQREWRRLSRDRLGMALVLCDIDFFKQYNDTYGHPAGDDCLVQVAQVLKQAVRRPGDFVGRYGGEEFVLVLPNTNSDGAIQIVQTIRSRLQQRHLPHLASPLDHRLTLSFGIAWQIVHPAAQAHMLVDTADQALYEAKASGRNRYVLRTLPPG